MARGQVEAAIDSKTKAFAQSSREADENGRSSKKEDEV